MSLSEVTKISEKHAEETLSPMLAEGEELLCTVNCAVKTSNMRYDIRAVPFICYASCTSGGRLLLAVFGADIFEEYSAKAFDLSLLKKLNISKRHFSEYRINAEFPAGNGSVRLEISVFPKMHNDGFPNQAANLEKMLEILRKYEI